ncbi:MAG TPA: prolipoprotein diacylglyceryl transferase [Methylomirabilota bacterium]|nr:prolipoprotein diacylglyceryl transferase [Methylomirabilota bacterium]
MHPVAFNLGPFPVNWFGILVAAAFLAGLWTAARRGVRDGLVPQQVFDAGPWLIVGAIVGARALYVLSYWEEDFAGQPLTKVFMIRQGGLVFYGGLIGATLGVLIYLGHRRLPLWKFADTLAPSIPLGHVFGRMGCLLNGCCHGRPTDVPWAIHFPADHATHGVGVHPTQIYEAALNLGLYAGLAWLYRRKRYDGQIFAFYLVSYAVVRSVVEAFRGDYATGYFGGRVTPGQMVSLFIFGLGIALVLLRRRAAPSCAARS